MTIHLYERIVVHKRPPATKLRYLHSLRWQSLTLLFVGALCLASAGCSKEKIKKAYEQAKTKTESIISETQKVVEEKLPETGKMRLEMTPTAVPITTLDLAMIQMEGRPNVIQIYSYDMSKTILRYPAVLLQGPTEVENPSELVGTSIECDLYYQATATSPITMTRPGSAIVITFEKLSEEDNSLSANLGIAALESSDGKPARLGGGSLVAVIRGEES